MERDSWESLWREKEGSRMWVRKSSALDSTLEIVQEEGGWGWK
jgi:hypothetical protein